ncbi:MAG: LysR family transcriptional regulator [Pseudomonadota bacterium]
MLNLNQLRVFHQVARSLNFTIAAKNLFVSQPAVTAQVKLFEKLCNLELFRKKGHQIVLTDEGQTIFRYASKIFELEREMEQVIEDLRKVKQGYLHLATSKTYARYLMPSLLAAFHKSFPGIAIDLNEGSSLDMTRSLIDFRNSVAIVAKVEDNSNINFIPFIREEVLLIAASDYHLTNRDEIGFEELIGEPIIMKEVGSGTRKLIEECFKKKVERLNIIAETSNVEFIKELVKQGVGISFLVRTSVKRELSQGELVTIPIKDSSIFLDVYLAYLRDCHLPMTAKAFLVDFLLPMIPKECPYLGVDSFVAEITGKRCKEGLRTLQN